VAEGGDGQVGVDGVAGPWWRGFFDARFAALWLTPQGAAGEAALAREVERVWTLLELRAGERVFDQCCGIGRLALPLARRGAVVLGVEQSAEYVAQARARAQGPGLACEFVCADAFEYVPEASCDAALNWYTSFGFAAEDARNEAMLRCALAALRPDGRFALECGNAARVLRRFQPRLRARYVTAAGAVEVVRDSALDVARGVLHQRWSYALPSGETVVRTGSARLYLPSELRAMLLRVGFADVRVRGEDGAGELSLDSARCVLLARRARS
jgi:SAM-dependent methyltransferase